MSWEGKAACAGLDTNLWFPERGESTAWAKAVCEQCCVRWECLDAGWNERFGIWGGMTGKEKLKWKRYVRTLQPVSA